MKWVAGLLLVLVVVGENGADEKLTAEQRGALEREARELNERAVKLYQREAYGEATALLRRVLAMRRELYPEKDYPRGHPDLARSLNKLGWLLQAQGEYAKAEPFYRDGLAM